MADDIATLGFRIESAGVDKARASLDAMAKSSKDAQSRSGDLKSSIDALTRALNEHANRLLAVEAANGRMVQTTKLTSGAMRAAREGLDQVGGSLSSLGSLMGAARNPFALLGLAAAAFGGHVFATHKNILTLAEAAAQTGEKASSIDKLGEAVRRAGGDASDAAKALQELRQNLDTATLGGGSVNEILGANGVARSVKSLGDGYREAARLVEAAYNGQERLTIATMFFGSEAAPSMVKAILSGADALERFSAGKAAIDAAVKPSQELDAIWKEARHSIDSVVDAITTAAIPALRAAANAASVIGSVFGNQRSRESLFLLQNQNASRTMGQSETDAFYNAVRGRANATRLPDPRAADMASEWERQIYMIRRRNAAMEAMAQTATQGAAAQAGLRVELQLEEYLDQKGIKNKSIYAAKIKEVADATRAATQAAIEAQNRSNMRFDRATLFMSSDDQQIAQNLRGQYGDNIEKIFASSEAAYMRATNQMRSFRDYADIATEGLQGFVTELRQGVSAGVAFSNMLGRIADRVTSMALDRSLRMLFNGSGGGGGLLSSIFGGGAGAGASTAPAAPTALSSLYHSGGIVGGDNVPGRYIHPAHYNDAPRFHTGLMPGEFPAILQRGEGVFTPEQMRALGGAGRAPVVNVTLVESADADGSVRQRQDANGGINIEVAVAKIAARSAATPGGDVNRVMTDQFRGRQRLASR